MGISQNMLQTSIVEKMLSNDVCQQSDTFFCTISQNFKINKITNAWAKMCGFKYFEDFIGLSMYEIKAPVSKSTPFFEAQCRKVINTVQPVHAIDIHTFANRELKLMYTTRLPVLNVDGQVSEIHTECVQLDSSLAVKILPTLLNNPGFKNKVSLSLEVIDAYDELDLTRAESICLFYILRGFSNNEMALILSKSVRTIEHHVSNILNKQFFQKRSELIQYAISSGLIYCIPKSFVEKFLNIH